MSNSLDLIIDLSLELWSAVIGFVPPFALQEILSALEDLGDDRRSTAYGWALVTFLAHLSFAQKDLLQSWHTRRCYERTRGQLFCALHYKALKRQDVSGKITHEDDEQGSADLGKIVNLMQSVPSIKGRDFITIFTDNCLTRGDTYAVSQRFWEFSGIFASPIRLVIALVFLYRRVLCYTCYTGLTLTISCRILGWSSLSGALVVFVASYVLNYPLAKYNIHVRIDIYSCSHESLYSTLL